MTTVTATTSPILGQDFETHVAPILIRRCLECHKGNDPSGGLSLESAKGLHQGGDSGPVITASKRGQSYLLKRVADGDMPPPQKGVSQKLPAAELKVLTGWLVDGAKWPDNRKLDLYEVTTDVRGGRDWWSFQPLQRPEVPPIEGLSSTVNPIDFFISAKLNEHRMQPAPAADSRTIVRRMYFDVIGLPPSYDELNQWTGRLGRPDGIQGLVEHLLSSPHFGERWARYWLDLVRYAESSGYERDQPKPFAWKYRDWVVRAINEDMPFDQFVRFQLAGDEIEGRDEQSVIATGFLRLGTWNDEPNDDADYRYERLEDMVHSTSSAFLGLTVKCARCHDHKFDPIPQDDYYRMASAFWPGPIAARDRKLLGGPSPEELGVENILGWTDLTSSPAALHVLKNGESDKPLNAVQPGTLTFASHLFRQFDAPASGAKTTGRRRQLADWIVSPDNPLTARVFVNRLWQHHFGEGLVRSPNNFGYKGEKPTHPRLLDWLASEFIDSGWSAKHIHKLILTSRTWQQSSLHPAATDYAERDSTNRLWWRANRRRLDAEALRDSMLTASGEIDLRIGGEGFKPTISAEALEGFSRRESAWKAAPDEEQRRRSLYIYVSRSLMPPMMTTFDQCDTTLPCAQRDVTTVPPQALAMMNSDFTHQRSDGLARRVAAKTDARNEQITAAWRFALGRNATQHERTSAHAHLKAQAKRFELATKRGSSTGGLPEVAAKPVLQLSAGHGVTASDTGLVRRWQSLAGNLNASQSLAGAQPLLVPNAVNGQPVIRFDGTKQFLRVSGEVIDNEQCTIIAVVSDRASKPGLREIISNWDRRSNVGSSVFLGFRDSNTVRFSDNFNSAGQVTKREDPFVLTAVNSSDEVRIWQNESLIAHRLRPLTNRKFGTEWVIGQQGNINGEFWDGDIAEILVFDRPLSTAELTVEWKRLLETYQLSRFPVTSPPIAANESPRRRALASLCHVLLNCNEFLYVD